MPEFLVGCVSVYGTDWRVADDERHARKIVAGFRRHKRPIKVIRIVGTQDVSAELTNPKGTRA